jgi:hypothetical protein
MPAQSGASGSLPARAVPTGRAPIPRRPTAPPAQPPPTPVSALAPPWRIRGRLPARDRGRRCRPQRDGLRTGSRILPEPVMPTMTPWVVSSSVSIRTSSPVRSPVAASIRPPRNNSATVPLPCPPSAHPTLGIVVSGRGAVAGLLRQWTDRSAIARHVPARRSSVRLRPAGGRRADQLVGRTRLAAASHHRCGDAHER